MGESHLVFFSALPKYQKEEGEKHTVFAPKSQEGKQEHGGESGPDRRAPAVPPPSLPCCAYRPANSLTFTMQVLEYLSLSPKLQWFAFILIGFIYTKP